MQLHVTIGNEAQQQQIRNELGILGEAARHFRLGHPLTEIWVPEDFDATVNTLQQTTDYSSRPGFEPMGKAIVSKEGTTAMVFHPKLFSSQFDAHIRYSIYWQEFCLLVNRSRFPVLTRHKLDRFANYFVNLYQLFDHYDAARKSFEFRDALVSQALEEDLSAAAVQDIEQTLEGYLNIIRNRSEYYDWIRFQITEYREHKEVQQFLTMVKGKITQLSFAIVYAYAIMDHYTHLQEWTERIQDAPMLNNNTLVFLEYLRLKYQKNAADLSDGIDVMEAFWANFGIRFVDGERSMECEVLDI